MKPRLELVEWEDAHYAIDDFNEEQREDPYIVTSVGWTREVNATHLLMSAELLPSGNGWRSSTRIPLKNVVKRTPLRRST